MANEYKQCPNGHYYQGDHCPYCKSSAGQGGAGSMKTEVFGVQGSADTAPNDDAHQPTMVTPGAPNPYGDDNKTIVGNGNAGGSYGGYTPNSGGKTTVIDNGPANNNYNYGAAPQNGGGMPMSGRTVFGDDDEMPSAPSAAGGQRPAFREARKLVGWLVSYTLDPLGVDFKLYEGRNIIGRDLDCSITIGDNRVSSKHAVLLFRAGKYSITDTQSSHGTFVNDRDIELEPCYLTDGDVIQVGKTVFKFRSSL